MKPMNGKQRIARLLAGETTDRPPCFDLIRNDAVLSYLAEETLTLENAERVVYRAMNRGVDGTRPTVRLPQAESQQVLPDGREQRCYRWTTWLDPVEIRDWDAYLLSKQERIAELSRWDSAQESELDEFIKHHEMLERQMPDVYLFWVAAMPVGLHPMCFEIGIEQFSYLLADYPELVDEFLEASVRRSIALIQATRKRGRKVGAYFAGDDIAFRSSTILSPSTLKRIFFPRLKRVVDAIHEVGAKVMYHSDGNLMGVLDDLVNCGIDVLNPIEVLAGMDIAEIHRRAPGLILAGGIDMSQLLPHGTPKQVEAAVQLAVSDAGGKIMVGSSSEFQDGIPLDNYLAMQRAIKSIRF
jgi:uroporphyrinogen-III decarboxylase